MLCPSRYSLRWRFNQRSILLNEDAVVVRADSPVLGVVILVWIVLLVVGEEAIELHALLEVLDGLHASDVLEEIEVTVDINAGPDQSVPVNALQLKIGVVLLELEHDSLSEVNVWSLDGVHVFSRHLKLIEIEVFREHFHYLICINLINYKGMP